MIHIIEPEPNMVDGFAEANSQPMVAYRNLLSLGTVANALLPADTPRIDATTEATDEYWQTSGTDTTVRSTLAVAEDADICFIAAHTLGSEGATLTVQYYDGAVWQDIAAVEPENDQPFMVVFPRTSAAGWGIKVSHDGVQVGVAWIGPRLILPGGVTPDYRPVWAARNVEKYPAVTRKGHFKGQRIQRVGASLSASFMPMDHAFVLEDMRAFRAHFDEGRAFIWSPGPGLFAEDVAYCWAGDGQTIAPTIMAGGSLVQFSIAMEAYAQP